MFITRRNIDIFSLDFEVDIFLSVIFDNLENEHISDYRILGGKLLKNYPEFQFATAHIVKIRDDRLQSNNVFNISAPKN